MLGFCSDQCILFGNVCFFQLIVPLVGDFKAEVPNVDLLDDTLIVQNSDEACLLCLIGPLKLTALLGLVACL